MRSSSGAGAGGGIVAKELAEAGLSVVLLERGQMGALRRAQRRRAGLPAHPRPGQSVRPRRCPLSPGGRQCRRHDAHRPAQRRRIQQQCRLRGRRDGQLRRDGLALHAAGFPPQEHLRRGRRLDPRRLADQLRRPGAVLREGRVRDRRRPATTRPIPSPRPRKKPYPMPAFPYNKEGRLVVEADHAAGAAPVSHPHAPQFGALQRPAGLHPHAVLRGLRLPGQRQGRHATTPSSPSPWPPATAR